MDATRFDRFARALLRATSRRRGIVIAIAALTGDALAADDAAVASRRTCRTLGASCSRSPQCCTGACETRRTAPRNQRNRCVCRPACDGKTCGPDGCGGFCGGGPLAGCYSGETCNNEFVCETGCSDFTDLGDRRFCEASVEGNTYTAYDGWYLWGNLFCAADADCTDHDLCNDPDYACYCERAWWNPLGYDRWRSEWGVCYATRQVPSPCAGSSQICSETITGEAIEHQGWDPDGYTGLFSPCWADDDCTDRDLTAACADTGRRCICELSGYLPSLDYLGVNVQGICQRIRTS